MLELVHRRETKLELFVSSVEEVGYTGWMKYLVTLDRDEDGVWIAECAAIPGCVSQGYSREEALKNVQDAIRGCLEARAELNFPIERRF